MKGSCAAPIAEFHPARAGPSVRTGSEPSELKAIAANPNRSRPVGYAGIFIEHVSGAAIDRPALFKAMKSTPSTPCARGAAFRSLTDALDTPSRRGRLVFHIFGGGQGYARRSEP